MTIIDPEIAAAYDVPADELDTIDPDALQLVTRDETIQERFERFHADNPQVLERLEAMAHQWFNLGNRKVAIGMLWEVLRWQHGIETTGDSGYRLNDHFRSRYARLLVEREPAWAGRFHTRSLRAA